MSRSQQSSNQQSSNQQGSIENTIMLSSTNIYKLPVEIWRQIFEECVAHTPRALIPLPWSDRSPKQRMHLYTNVAISHVCRHFRQIALLTSALWSTLNLDGTASELGTFLERSGEQPLTITSMRELFRKGYMRHHDLFEAIAGRVVNIDTLVNWDNFKDIRICTNLRHIMLRGSEYAPQDSNVEAILDQFGFLQTLWWANVSDDPIILSPPKMYCLSSLHFSFRMVDTTLLSILRCCPALKSLAVHVLGGEAMLEGEDIHLPHLKNLQIQFAEEDSWISKLHTPPVLDVCHYKYSLPYSNPTSLHFPLGMKSLLLGDYFDLSGMVSRLEEEPGILKSLTLAITYQTDLKRLLKTLSSPILCPQLEEVNVQYIVPFARLDRPAGYRRGDYEKLLNDIIASRGQADLPPLRFTWNQKLIVLGEVTPEPTAESDPITEPITPIPRRQDATGSRRSVLPERMSKAPRGNKALDWLKGKLNKTTTST
ncbi:hypothetical protein CPB86DRAFT_828246 [Serendipita vermifera]|nr:hypothetical protein CPB86DRAFT_828246 [Serendipita vermifera]